MQAGRIDAVVTNEMVRALSYNTRIQLIIYILTEERGYFGEKPYGVGVGWKISFVAELNRVLNDESRQYSC